MRSSDTDRYFGRYRRSRRRRTPVGGANLSVQNRLVPAATPPVLSCPPSRPLIQAKVPPTGTTESPTTLLASGTLETMVSRKLLNLVSDRKKNQKAKTIPPLVSDGGMFHYGETLSNLLKKMKA